MTKDVDLDEKFTKFSKEASTYIDRKKKEKEKKDYKKKHGRDKFAFAGKSMDRKHSMGIAAEFDPKVNENKIVIGGKELDREWTCWWWRKNEKWTVVDGKNNMLASAKSSGEAEKWMKKLKDASQTRGDFSLAIGNPKLMLNHGQFGMPGLDFDKIFKSVNKDPDQLTIRKIDKKDHDRYFERAKKVNKKYDYTNLELTYDGGRKHYAPKKVKEEIGEAYKDLPPHLQKLVKKIEKKQKDWNKQNPNAKIKTLVYNPETGKPDIEVKENMDLKDTIKKVIEDNSNDKSDDGEGLDKVQPKAVKKKFKDRKDKDIDNDGDVDSSDKFLHKKRKAISKAMSKEQKSFSKMFSHIKSLMQGK